MWFTLITMMKPMEISLTIMQFCVLFIKPVFVFWVISNNCNMKAFREQCWKPCHIRCGLKETLKTPRLSRNGLGGVVLCQESSIGEVGKWRFILWFSLVHCNIDLSLLFVSWPIGEEESIFWNSPRSEPLY